jgi:RNA-binding motif X-linked protein 2
MNPLTQIKNTQKATALEIRSGFNESASWHARFKHSAYVFAGGLDFDLTEGDLLAVFAQYGEIVDVHLVRDKTTGKSRGFAFLAYEDQRSTVLAVDNLNGARVSGRIVRVEHVDNYKKKRAEVGEVAEWTDTASRVLMGLARCRWKEKTLGQWETMGLFMGKQVRACANTRTSPPIQASVHVLACAGPGDPVPTSHEAVRQPAGGPAPGEGAKGLSMAEIMAEGARIRAEQERKRQEAAAKEDHKLAKKV